MHLRQQLAALQQDAHLSLRLVRRSPLFYSVAILVLAIGIGANGAVFGILQSVLLQPLPYEDASRLVLLSHRFPDEPTNKTSLEFSGPMSISVRDASRNALGEVAAGIVAPDTPPLGARQGEHLEAALDVVVDGRAIRLNGASVTPNFLRVLGVRAAIGRLPNEDDASSLASSVVLSDATWRREFGADSGVVGRTIVVGSGGSQRTTQTAIIAAVLPRNVHFAYPREVEMWRIIPWTTVAESNPYAVGEYMLVARVRSGIAMQWTNRIAATMRRDPLIAPANARGGEKDILGTTPMREWVVGDTTSTIYLLGGVAVLLLLVTCVTVSNGLLARISERRQELAVRIALGADRNRIVQQLLVEGAMLSLGGSVAGVIVALAIQPVMRAILPASLPMVGDLEFDASILAFGAFAATATTLLAAVAPAYGGTRSETSATMTRASANSTAGKTAVHWRHWLVGAQGALTTMLLIFSTLLLTSLWKLGQVPLGFNPENVLAIDLQLFNERYRTTGAIAGFQEQLSGTVRNIPGVVAAGITSAIPFRGFDSPARLTAPNGQGRVDLRVRFVDSSYFVAMGVSSIRGRLLNSADRNGAADVAVISKSLAQKLFGAEDPIGKFIDLARPTQIVGMVGDLRYAGMDKDPSPAVYVSVFQNARPLSTLTVRIAEGANRRMIVDGIRNALRTLDPDIPMIRVAMVDDIVDATIVSRRFYTVAASVFAAIALTLTTVGLLLVVTRVVSERRRELAIRSALGANFARIGRAAVGDALAATVAGVSVGLFLTFASSTLLEQFMFQIGAHSPSVYVMSAVVVISGCVAATWMPLRRFGRLPLTQMLRQE